MKGVLYAWIMITIVVFVVGFIWIIFSQIYVEHLFPQFEEDLMANNDTATTYTWIRANWSYWPLILIFGMIVYGIVSALRREPYSSYG